MYIIKEKLICSKFFMGSGHPNFVRLFFLDLFANEDDDSQIRVLRANAAFRTCRFRRLFF